MQDIQFPKPKIHLFVCVNEREEGHPTPSCGPRMKREDVKDLKRWVVENGWATKVYVTKAKCLGFCNPEGSVACIYPKGRFVKGIQSIDDLKQLILEELEN
jgi:predicted metal-binding protein